MTERNREKEALEALKQAAPAEWEAWERAAAAWNRALEIHNSENPFESAHNDMAFAGFSAVGEAVELAESLLGVLSPFKDGEFGPDSEDAFEDALELLEGRSGPEVAEVTRAVKTAYAIWKAVWGTYHKMCSEMDAAWELGIVAFEQERQEALRRAAPEEWKAYEAAKGNYDDPEVVAGERIYAAEEALKDAEPEKWTKYDAARETLRAAERSLNVAAREKWAEYKAAQKEADEFEENHE